MNLAILIYQHTDNPKGLPDVWPAEVIDLGDSTSLPNDQWILMTDTEYTEYLSQYRSLYDVWLAANPRQSGTINQEVIKVGHTISCGYSGVAGIGRYLEIGNNPTSDVPFLVVEQSNITALAVYNGSGLTSGEIAFYINGSVVTSVVLNNSSQNILGNLFISLNIGDLLSWKVVNGSFNKVNMYTQIQSEIIHC